MTVSQVAAKRSQIRQQRAAALIVMSCCDALFAFKIIRNLVTQQVPVGPLLTAQQRRPLVSNTRLLRFAVLSRDLSINLRGKKQIGLLPIVSEEGKLISYLGLHLIKVLFVLTC